MSTIRDPAVAGLFYTANPQQLRQEIHQYLAAVPEDLAEQPPKALIAPHAGYIYSGPIAATAYAQLYPIKDQIHRVVLLGPSHRVPFRGLASSSATHFKTPLGTIELDRKSIDDLNDLPQVHVLNEAHIMEHSLEVHLPFLQEVLNNFKLIPLVVGDARPEEVAEVLERLWGGSETLIVVSSDLSHYHGYATAKQLDTDTSAAIESLQYQRLHSENACGCVPVSGLLLLAQRKGLQGHILDLRNSGDTAGTKDRVVGYGAYSFTEN